MAPTIFPLNRLQLAPEAVAGTPITEAADFSRVVFDQGTFRESPTFEQFEDVVDGTLARTSRDPVNTRNMTEIECQFKLDFQQILFMLLSGLEDVAPVLSGVGDAIHTYTFSPDAMSPDAIKTYTAQFSESDGTNIQGLIAAHMFTSGFELSGTDDGVPDASMTMMGRKANAGAPVDTDVPRLVSPPSAMAAVYVDDSWANLGNTFIESQAYGWRWNWANFLRAGYYLDKRRDLDLSRVKFGKRTAELGLDAEHDAAGDSFVQGERAHKLNGDSRFVRVEIEGKDIIPGTPYKLTIDGCYKHSDESLGEIGGERDGAGTRSATLRSAFDPVSEKDVQVTLVTNL